MSRIEHLSDSVTLYLGDCIEVLQGYESNSFDACVTDPPYELSNDGQASADRVAAKVLFPNHPHIKAKFGRQCHLDRLALKIAELGRVCVQPRPSAAMPIIPVALDEKASFGEIDIENADNATRFASEQNGLQNGKSDLPQHLGDFHFEFRDAETALDAARRVGCGFTSGGLGIGFRVPAASIPSLFIGGDIINDGNPVIGSLHDTLADCVGALPTTEDESVARLNLSGRPDDRITAVAALKLLLLAKLAGTKLVGTATGTRRLPPEFQTRQISVICPVTNRTLSFNLLIHAHKLASSGFMGKSWDGMKAAYDVDIWRRVFRVLKPGAHLLAFGGTRTYHRMACAIEDAGFEIRDCVMWIYGSGFPKSHDVSKAIDKAAGAEREVVGFTNPSDPRQSAKGVWGENGTHRIEPLAITAPATDAARQWSGFGTALKPACEPIVLARKPLSESTVAANVLRWGTGALNIDGCRVGDFASDRPSGLHRGSIADYSPKNPDDFEPETNGNIGRWPANVIHDGSDEVVGAFPETDAAAPPGRPARARQTSGNMRGTFNGTEDDARTYGDSGSAARFFYTAKADSDDRLGSKHPTVKPLDLMQYLVRLVTPPRGLVLDPFAGTGTTGEAAFREGMRAVLIEKEEEYQDDIRRRMKLALAGPDERARQAAKARMKDKPVDYGPLFGNQSP